MNPLIYSYFHIHVVVSAPCFPGHARLANNVTTDTTLTGTVEVCVDGEYVPVCGHSEANVGSLTDIAQFACSIAGYSGELHVMKLCV